MGLIDLHVHAGPSVMPRSVDGVEMLNDAVAAGYSAFVIKDHYFPTMMGAQMIEKHLGRDKCRVFGGIALNNSVGGINLKAVDAAVALGAKIVWMPTVSSQRHKDMHSGKGLAFPGSKGMSVPEKCIYYLDESGNVLPEVVEVLNYLSEHKDVILATGHGCRDEVDACVRKAHELGIEKILINHPHYMIGASIEDMAAWSKMGAYIELNATVFVPDSKFCTNDIMQCREIVDAVDVDHIVIDSDYGQKSNEPPVNGLLKFINMLKKQCGFTEQDIRKATEINPAKLLGIEIR